MYIFAYIKLQSYWTKVHQIYTQCSQIITDELFKNHNGDIAIRFGMPGKVNSAILPILTIKLVAMATSLERSEKGNQIGNLRSNTYQW